MIGTATSTGVGHGSRRSLTGGGRVGILSSAYLDETRVVVDDHAYNIRKL